MKTIIIRALSFVAVSACIVSMSLAQGGAFLSLRAADGSVRTAPVSPQGSCTIDNLKPGTYGVALLVPAVQKVRDAAARSSAAKGHDKWIDVESWSWGASQAAGHGGGGGAGKVSVHDISVTKSTDKSTPKLAEAAVKGKVFSGAPARSQATQTMTHNGQQYYEVKLQDVMVSSFQTSSSSPTSGGDRPMESLSLNFTKIKWDLKENVK